MLSQSELYYLEGLKLITKKEFYLLQHDLTRFGSGSIRLFFTRSYSWKYYSFVFERLLIRKESSGRIKKSEWIIKSNRPISNSKKMRIKKIYSVALENRGGQVKKF